MKPKILTKLANIAAKLAGSKDYDPKVKPNTPLEYYLDQLPVVPFPTSRDDGKILMAYDEGTYKLVQPIQPAVTPEELVSAFESMSDEQKETVMSELGVTPAPLVVTFSGTDTGGNATCDKTWAEISAADTAGTNIIARYAFGKAIYTLNVILNNDVGLMYSTYLYITDLAIPNDVYITIRCSINISNQVSCFFEET